MIDLILFTNLLTREKIPCQQGDDSLITSPKLYSISFGMAISDEIVAPLLSTKKDLSASQRKT